MPGPLDQLVNVNITLASATVSQESFSIPLIVGPTATGWADVVHTYSAPSGMLTDGFTTSSPEYIYALELYAQTVTPTQFKVGKRTTATAQVDTLAVSTLATGHAYKVTVDGTVYSYTSSGGDTQQSILTALDALIVAGNTTLTGAVTGTGSGALLTLTGTSSGAVHTYSAIDSDLTHAVLTAANGIVNDLTNIAAEDNTWYGACIASGSDADILQAASYIEANQKLLVAVSSTAGVAQSTSTTDVGAALQAAGYKRTALVFSPSNITKGIDAAWLGLMLPQTPGAASWCYKSLAGITADTLTATQQSVCIGNPVAGIPGKNVNIYQTVAGVNITQMGTSAAGQFLDITVGLDWLHSQIETNIYQLMTSQPKVPYTDQGVSSVISAVKAAIDTGATNNLIDPSTPVTVTAPTVATVSANQRASRIAPTITFTCRLQGASNAVLVNGTVSV